MTRALALFAVLSLACGGADDTDTAADTDLHADTDTIPAPTDWTLRVPLQGTIDAEGGLAYDSGESYMLRWVDGPDGTGNFALSAESCLAFQGSFAGGDAASMSLWFRPQASWDPQVTDRQVLSVFDQGTWQVYYADGALHAEVYTAEPRGVVDASTAVDLAAGSWHHLAWVAEGGEVELFLDGDSVTTEAYAAADGVYGHTGTLYFGCSARLNAFVDLADVQVYDRGLGAAEVEALADAY